MCVSQIGATTENTGGNLWENVDEPKKCRTKQTLGSPRKHTGRLSSRKNSFRSFQLVLNAALQMENMTGSVGKPGTDFGKICHRLWKTSR